MLSCCMGGYDALQYTRHYFLYNYYDAITLIYRCKIYRLNYIGTMNTLNYDMSNCMQVYRSQWGSFASACSLLKLYLFKSCEIS